MPNEQIINLASHVQLLTEGGEMAINKVLEWQRWFSG